MNAQNFESWLIVIGNEILCLKGGRWDRIFSLKVLGGDYSIQSAIHSSVIYQSTLWTSFHKSTSQNYQKTRFEDSSEYSKLKTRGLYLSQNHSSEYFVSLRTLMSLFSSFSLEIEFLERCPQTLKNSFLNFTLEEFN